MQLENFFKCLVIVFKLQFSKTRFSIVFENLGLRYLRLWVEDCRIGTERSVWGVKGRGYWDKNLRIETH